MALENVSSPNTLAGMGVDAELILKAINKKLQMESTLDDVFESLGANVVSSGRSVAIPDAIFLKLEAVATGSRQVTVPFLKALTGAPHTGAGTPIGSELKQNLKYATFKYAEYSQAVASEAWGVNANDMGVYGVFEQIQPQISKYMAELHGERIREALLLTHGSVLTGAGTETASWNKNWFIANTALGGQPAFGIGAGEFTEAIGDVMEAATTGGASGDDAEITLNYIRNLNYYAANVLRIEPVIVGGKRTYIVLIPSTQANKLKANENGQLGDIYTGMVRAQGDEMNYTGVLGRVDDCLLIEDQRYPTITKSGADGSYALAPKFVKPGNEDARNKAVHSTTNESWDIGFLLGKAAVCEWEVKKLHFETESQNYGYNKGTGVFGESGISLVEYDIDTITDTSKENTGSIVLAMATPAISA